MKKSGLLNSELLAAIGELGHTDEVAASIEALVGKAERLPHDELKDRGSGARFAVRSGEFTPYSNGIVICGVPF